VTGQDCLASEVIPELGVSVAVKTDSKNRVIFDYFYGISGGFQPGFR